MSVARPTVAVVGAGISGLTAAYLLARTHQVTLHEAEPRLGGHAHTHTVPTGSTTTAVDSGFIVHNDRTYPHLRRLFAELGVATRPTEMSMSIRSESTGLEYAGGKGIGGFLARPRQLLRRDYVTMLLAVRRFHGLAREFLESSDDADPTTYGDFVVGHGFSRSFVELYAVPLVSCVWSSGRGDALDYPARYLFRFLANHGMLSVGDSPTWMTVVGGSARYVEAVAARIDRVRVSDKVLAVTRTPTGARVRTAGGTDAAYDKVVVATHADQALTLLADATPQEKEVLGAFRYSANETVLHRDASLLPRAPRARASWNYLASGPGKPGPDAGPIVTYWMNRLQGLDPAHPLLVTLNATERIAPESIIATMTYRHPIHDVAAVRAQSRLAELATPTFALAGAYHGWGFHEDGCRAGVDAARALGVDW